MLRQAHQKRKPHPQFYALTRTVADSPEICDLSQALPLGYVRRDDLFRMDELGGDGIGFYIQGATRREVKRFHRLLQECSMGILDAYPEIIEIADLYADSVYRIISGSEVPVDQGNQDLLLDVIRLFEGKKKK